MHNYFKEQVRVNQVERKKHSQQSDWLCAKAQIYKRSLHFKGD